jgi:hypothetical protein
MCTLHVLTGPRQVLLCLCMKASFRGLSHTVMHAICHSAVCSLICGGVPLLVWHGANVAVLVLDIYPQQLTSFAGVICRVLLH